MLVSLADAIFGTRYTLIDCVSVSVLQKYISVTTESPVLTYTGAGVVVRVVLDIAISDP